MFQQFQYIAEALKTAEQPAIREHNLSIIAIGCTSFGHDAVIQNPFRPRGANFADNPTASPQHLIQIFIHKIFISRIFQIITSQNQGGSRRIGPFRAARADGSFCCRKLANWRATAIL